MAIKAPTGRSTTFCSLGCETNILLFQKSAHPLKKLFYVTYFRFITISDWGTFKVIMVKLKNKSRIFTF